MTIGEFSRAVRLSAKALRLYHRVGVLTPALVDANSGYRMYSPQQIPDAQIVRALRRLDFSIESIRGVLSAESIEARSVLISEHLDRMERKLDEARSAVHSLRSMFEDPTGSVAIDYRNVPGFRVLAMEATIPLSDLSGWFREAISHLTEITEQAVEATVGPFGGIWSNELFEEERGSAMVHVTVDEGFDPRLADSRTALIDLPPVELAVVTHVGSDDGVPQAYAALGEHVARHELSVDAPVRETYLSGLPGIDERIVIEIGWPIFRVMR